MFDDQTEEDARKRMESMNLKEHGGDDTTVEVMEVEVEDISPLGTGLLAAMDVEDTPLGTRGGGTRASPVTDARR